MFLEVIFVTIFTSFWLMLYFYGGFMSNFTIDNQENLKNSLIVHGGKDYNLKIHSMNKGEIDNWNKLETLKDVSFLETSKKHNFVNLNIGKVKGTFELEFSSPCKISGVVYKMTDKSYDVQFTQSLNKYSIDSSYNRNTKLMRLSLDNKAFQNNFSPNNMAYYVYVPKEKPVKKIFFDSVDENKEIIISLFVEPYTMGETENDENKEKLFTNVKNENQKYYDGVRYILKKSDLKNTLELNNFIVVNSKRSFGATGGNSNGKNKIIMNYSSPLMFYVNEFSDYD